MAEHVRVSTYLAPEERRGLRLLAAARDVTVAGLIRQLVLKELGR
jgi:hypothetical protein